MVQEIGGRAGQDPVGVGPGHFQMVAVDPPEGGIRDHVHVPWRPIRTRGRSRSLRGGDELERRRIIWLAAPLLALEERYIGREPTGKISL